MIELNKIYCEDCRETMKRMENNSVDSIVTDPPYELGFMGKHWDSSGIAYNIELWKECLRVLKPGGYLLAFGGTRTSHRMVCAIEDAGFEIRDSILWLYGSGFPKSMDISKQIDKQAGEERPKVKKMAGDINNARLCGKSKSPRVERLVSINKAQTDPAKQWDGWGTALKPAHEPICVARKPIAEKTVVDNILAHGTGGINIDGCRIGNEIMDNLPAGNKAGGSSLNMSRYEMPQDANNKISIGRFPANIILDEFTAEELDKQVPDAGAFAKVKLGHSGKSSGIYGDYATRGDDGDTFYDDKGGASRFFYIAKADSGERNEGLYQFDKVRDSDRTKTDGTVGANPRNRSNTNKNNFHPTVKPIKLIQYLQRLVTPKGGLTYDPFGGSGTSALSAQNERFQWILSEITPEYADIANKRVFNNGGLFK